MHTSTLWLLFALTAQAQDTPAAGEPAAEGDTPAADAAVPRVDVVADLRAEYIQGEPILVRLTASNPAQQTQEFADLASRPHLVKFELVDPQGKKQVWYSTPPDQDDGRTWKLPVRGNRTVLLQIPQSQRLKAGTYTLTVKIDGHGDLAPTTLRLAKAKPVAGEVVFEPRGATRAGHQTVWVHQAKEGFDLYLHHADGKNPNKLVADHHLAHMDKVVEPHLSLSTPQARWERYVYWQRDARTIEFFRLEGQGLIGPTRRIQTPYPKVELIGRASTDTAGMLNAPVWIPAPSGDRGELKVLSVGEREAPTYRNVVQLKAKPAWLETGLDTGGNLRMLVPGPNGLDLYTLLAGVQLPASGKALARPEGEGAELLTPVAGRFGVLDESDGRPGGLAILVLFERVDGSLEGRWYALDGSELGRVAPVTPPPKAEIVDILPLSYDDYGVLLRSATGLAYAKPSEPLAPIAGVKEGTLLYRDGATWIRSLEAGGPVRLTQIKAPAQ
jgi:hypothetical protein